MMVADTSAIMAVLMNEPEKDEFNRVMAEDGEVLVSTATAVELFVVALRRSDALYQEAVEFLERPYIRLMPPDEMQARLAGEAFRRFGRGRGPAALNFGDTFPYALASALGLPLMFKGDDFSQTDIVQVDLSSS